MVWSQLLNSKEFWGAIAAGVPILTAFFTGFIKMLSGDGLFGKSRIDKLSAILKEHADFLSEEEKKFLKERVNHLIMRPQTALRVKANREKFVYLSNRGLRLSNKKLIPYLEYSENTKRFYLDRETPRFKTANRILKLCSIIYAVGFCGLVYSYFSFNGPLQLNSPYRDPIICFLMVLYGFVALFAFFRLPGKKKTAKFNEELSEINCDSFQ
ncbi:hypothetical protein [Enterobacter hormaechei]|uniref:hypothetical protein n=1 Tax=Enterobacter hormaechei TaxID=158836 RepID=UPI00209A6598|nr:hypothetical protein [Enterobacter hormaechei]EKK5415641.1 hypothetical protein [Enterobacter hormaechei]ELD3430580.1 hypothetical protein [Enterobacter hormaechei]MCO7992569.1 hypothetical protein [Enterobacter hormaechei]MCO8002662.1 hypothetical protein [Enterobacter hormaechei]MCO8016544.1 hypothetical protein [Enterobacter hormaechei]